MLLWDIFRLLFVVAMIISAIREYKAKNFKSIPSTIMIVYFISIVLIYDYIPESIELPFVYFGLIVGIFGSLFTSIFYKQRNDKFRYWFFLVITVLLCIATLLGFID